MQAGWSQGARRRLGGPGTRDRESEGLGHRSSAGTPGQLVCSCPRVPATTQVPVSLGAGKPGALPRSVIAGATRGAQGSAQPLRRILQLVVLCEGGIVREHWRPPSHP